MRRSSEVGVGGFSHWALAVAIVVAIAACGQSGTIVAADGAVVDSTTADRSEAGGDASVLDRYLGAWTVQGTQVLDCAGQQQTTQNSGSLLITVGTASDLIVMADCAYPFDIQEGTAQLTKSQTCATAAGSFAATYQTYTILTTDGQTGELVAAGTETGTTQSGATYSCIFTQQATITR